MNIKDYLYKFEKILLSVFIIFTSAFSQLTSSSAADLSGEFKYGGDTGYYIKSKAGSHGSSSNGLNYKLIKRKGSSTWEKAFCMEPGAPLHDGVDMTPSQYTKTRIARLAYLGYYSQRNAKNYINTQALIYDELGDTVSYVSTGNYDSFKKATLAKYDKYTKKPHFNAKTISAKAGKTVTITDTNKVLSDYKSFSVTKNGITLKHTKGQNTMTVTVTKTCKVKTQKFTDSVIQTAGGYKFDSTSTVNVFYKSSEQDLAVFGFVDPVTMNTTVEVKYAKLKISKTDENGNSVPKVKFQLSYNANMSSPIGTYTTGDDGSVTIDNLAEGTVYVKEVGVPEHLVLDSTVHKVTLTADKTASFKATNDIKKGRIIITKKDEKTNQTILKAGTEFNIIEKKTNKVVDTIVTNDKGIATSKELEYGEYTVKETKAPIGYSLNITTTDVNINVDNKDYDVIVKNKPVEAHLIIEKTGEVLTGYENGKFVYSRKGLAGMDVQIIAEEDIINPADGSVLYPKGKVVTTATTGNNGKVSVDLPLGKYRVKEIKAPKGYVLSKEEKIVALIQENEEATIISGSTGFFNDRQKVRVSAVKKDKNNKLLQGATIGLYAKEDINNYEGKTIVKKDTLLSSSTTNDKGTVNFDGDLPLSHYYLKEIKAPNGYVLSHGIYEIDATSKDQTTSVYTFEKTVENNPIIVKFSKIDLTTSKEIAGAKLEVIDKSSEKVVESWISETSPHYINNLEKGKVYILKETKTPQGYVTAEQIEFTVLGTEEVQSIIMKDDITKIDTSKTDITNGKELEGAKLEVRDENNKVIDSWISGKIPHRITKLVAGKSYTLIETKPADGYATAENVKFTVKDAGVVQKVEMKDDITKIDISKTDITNSKELEGAKLEVRDENNKVIDSWTSTKTPHRIEKLVVGKSYTLIETKPADGYTTAESIKFTIKDTGIVQKVVMKDDITKIDISKTDITNGKELEGAKLEVRDENNKVIDSWTSTKTPHRIEKLIVGKSYTLIETKPADGYTTAESIKFTVKDTGVVQKVEMKDDITKIDISKTDITSGKELEGAKLEVRDENNKVIDSWTSTKTPHRITKLVVGKSYTLIETKPADGYATAENVKFTVKDAGTVQKVIMKDDITKIDISKTDITNGKELEGAKLEVRDENNKVIDSWTSGKTPHRIEKLVVGKTYTLIETKPADGFATAENVKFTVKDAGVVQKIEMKDDITKIDISKTDITNGKELEGAKLEVRDENNKVIDSWTSGKTPHRIEKLIVGKTYTLIETKPADSYATAESVKFTVKNTGTVQKVEMKDDITKIDISKTDITNGKELEGAKLEVRDEKNIIIDSWTSTKAPHRIERLIAGKTYTLIETKPADGYTTAESVKFTVKDTGTVQKVIMKDDITKIDISKTDITNGKELEGAKLEVRDENNKLIDSWTSTKTPHRITKLIVGKTYTLKETLAPYGYAVSEAIKFTVKDTSNVQKVIMKDKIVFGQLKWKKTGEIFNQVIMGANEFGTTQSPVWNQGNISGAEITIYALEDIIIGQNTFYKANEKIETLISDSQDILSRKLPVGKYYYVETKTPHGYITDTNRHYFEVSDNHINELQIISSSLSNKRYTFDIDMTKVLEEQKVFVNSDAYKDIIFGIYAREDIKDYFNLTAIEKDTMIATTGINKDGHLENVPDLPEGKYYLRELATNSQFVINENEYDFDIAYHGGDVTHFTVSVGIDGKIDNRLARGAIIIHKKDSMNADKKLSDIQFNLSAKDDMSDIIMSAKTDENGSVLFDGLELGTYYIQEDQQIDGYVLNDHIYKVEVKADGDLLEVICENKPTEMEFSKQDFTDSKELEGAKITVADKLTGNIIDEWISGKEPHKIMYLIEGRQYIMTEITAPDGYQTAESIEFTAKDGEKIIMKDKKKPIIVKTGDNIRYIVYIGSALVAAVGIAVFIKRGKEDEQ